MPFGADRGIMNRVNFTKPELEELRSEATTSHPQGKGIGLSGQMVPRRPKADKGEFEGAQPLQCPWGQLRSSGGSNEVESLRPHEPALEEAGSCGIITDYLTFIQDYIKVVEFVEWLDLVRFPVP